MPFIHECTTVHRITMEHEECVVSASVGVIKRTLPIPDQFSEDLKDRISAVLMKSTPRFDIDFTLRIPASLVGDAYNLTIAEGRQLFERFTSSDEAAA